MKQRFVNFIVLCIFAHFVIACNRETTQSNVSTASSTVERVVPKLRGEWTSERIYHNEYFGFNVSLPEGWYLTKGKDQARDARAAEFLAGEDQNLKSALQSSIEKTISVFWVYQYPPGTPGKTNPNMSMLIENLEHLPGVKTGGDYLELLESTLKMSNKNFVFKNSPVQSKLGALDAWSRDAEIAMGKLMIKQRFYAIFKDGVVLLVGTTFLTPEDETAIQNIVASIKP